MHRQTTPTVPRHITEALDASLADIAAGTLDDAEAVQAEACAMLADHELQRPVMGGSLGTKRTRAARIS